MTKAGTPLAITMASVPTGTRSARSKISILSRDGQLIGIVAEVGGFLDIADKHVMLQVQDVNLVAVDDETYAYVTRYSEEELEAMQGVDEGFWN